MRRLHLSPSTEAARASAGPSILVGQRCVLTSSASATDAVPCSVYAVSECVPCEDVSVAEEQVEYLERVLPFGVEVLGVAGSAAEVAKLTAQLRHTPSQEWVGVVEGTPPGTSRIAHLLGSPATLVPLVEAAVSFVEVRVALHSCEDHLPFLVTAPGGPATVVDGEGDVPLGECVPSLTHDTHVVQLGAARSTLCIHVVLAPAFASARGLYDVLRRQINAAVSAGTTRLVEVQSHNAHVSYCCRVAPDAAAAATGDLSAERMAEMFEMIEDATGATATHSDMRGHVDVASSGASAGSPAAESTTHGASTAGKEKSTGNEMLLLLLGVAVVAAGVLMVTMR